MNKEIREILRNCEKTINDAAGNSETTNKILDYITDLENRIKKSRNIIQKFKEKFIICFDKDLWRFVKSLEKVLVGNNNE